MFEVQCIIQDYNPVHTLPILLYHQQSGYNLLTLRLKAQKVQMKECKRTPVKRTPSNKHMSKIGAKNTYLNGVKDTNMKQEVNQRRNDNLGVKCTHPSSLPPYPCHTHTSFTKVTSFVHKYTQPSVISDVQIQYITSFQLNMQKQIHYTVQYYYS